MAGMYPNNETLELFGETVSWPGIDEDGKFTNGSFSDPAVRPSFIPAETINLILDNISGLLRALNKTPNNQSPDQLALAVEDALKQKAPMNVTLADEDEANTLPAISSTPIASLLQTVRNFLKWLVNKKADINNPTFTGIVLGPTPDEDDDPKSLATIEYVNSRIERQYVEKDYPIGIGYEQGPNDPSPSELGLPGVWERWNARAEVYGLSASIPNYANYNTGASFAANAYALYHLDGDNYSLFQAKTALANVPAQLNQVSWNAYEPDLRIERRFIQPGPEGWAEADLPIGYRLTSGEYAGMYITEIIVRGGKFPSFAGGNRPPFISGGVAGDAIRNVSGSLGRTLLIKSSGETVTPPFLNFGDYETNIGSGVTSFRCHPAVLDLSIAVPTGAENSPRTLSVQYWRRVA
jgi:hypothetical protein